MLDLALSIGKGSQSNQVVDVCYRIININGVRLYKYYLSKESLQKLKYQ